MTTPAKNKPKKQSAAASLLATSQRTAKEIPSAELEALPRDVAKNHDHYLYGAPKKRWRMPAIWNQSAILKLCEKQTQPVTAPFSPKTSTRQQ